MRSSIRLTVSFAFIVAMLITPATMAIDATPVAAYIGEPIEIVQPATSDSKDTYQGTMRIFISEPESRYTDFYGAKYQFGFLDWGAIQALNINTGEVYTHVVTWDASDAGFTGVNPDNIVAQAVLFNSTPYTNYSDPPTRNPFFAYWVDAAAQALPGFPGQNISDLDFTHTVFVEKVTQKG